MAEHVMARTFINQTEVSDKIADSTKQIAILQGSSRPATSSNGTILISNGPLVRDGSIKIGFDIRDSSTGNAGDTIIGNYVKTGGGEKDSLSTAVGYGTQVAVLLFQLVSVVALTSGMHLVGMPFKIVVLQLVHFQE